jgi:nucleoside-diphosphate-sugar epimerase
MVRAMRVLVAGATGVIGRAAVARLRAAGHEVVGTTRTPEKASALADLGVEPIVLDLLDAARVSEAVGRSRAEVVVNMVTDLSTPPSFRTLDASFASTNRLRREGTEHLVAACEAHGVERYVGQGFAGWFAQPGTGWLTDEQAAFLTRPPRAARRTTEALRHLERRVTGSTAVRGVVLRFGPLYGPHTSMGAGGSVVEDVRRGRIPIVGSGAGTWSFTHVDDAGAAVAFAVERAELTGVFNVVDDDPAPVSVWLPELATALEAPAPRAVPAWLARPVVGGFGIHVMTVVRGADNAALRRLGFVPAVPSWRDGFRAGLS